MFVLWRAVLAWAFRVEWPRFFFYLYIFINTHLHTFSLLLHFFRRLYILDPFHQVQTLEWRHQVVPTVFRPNVRRPTGPLTVNTPTNPFSSSPTPSVVPGSQFQSQSAIVPPLIGHILVPPSDTSKGTNGWPEVSKLHAYSVWKCMLKDKLAVSLRSVCKLLLSLL